MSLQSLSVRDAIALKPTTLNKQPNQPHDTVTEIREDAELSVRESRQPTPASDSDFPQGIALSSMIIALLLSKFLAALDMTIIATAIPSITADFHSLDQSGWYGSAFFLTLAVFQAPWGKVYKSFSLRWCFVGSIALFELGSLASGSSTTSNGLIFGRALQGLGAAGLNLGAYVILTVIVPKKHVPKYVGLFGAVYALASVAGPLLGGVFTDQLTWRWCFWINLPIGGVTLVLFLLFFREPKRPPLSQISWRKLPFEVDIPGIVLCLGSLICYMLALQWAGVQKPWNSADVIAMLVVAVALAALFVADQVVQKERALLVTRIICQRNIAALTAFIFFLNAANFLMIYYLPVYFQAVDGSSPTESGVQNLPYILSSSLSALATGYILGKIGHCFPFLLGGSVLAVVGAALLYTLKVGSSVGEYVGFQLVLGIAVGMCIQVPIIMGQALSKPEDIPVTTATILFGQFMSGAVSLSAAQSSFQNQLKIHLPSSISLGKVLAVGSTNVQAAFGSTQGQEIVDAYLSGLKASWALGIALAGVSVIFALIPERVSVKKTQAPVEPGARSGNS